MESQSPCGGHWAGCSHRCTSVAHAFLCVRGGSAVPFCTPRTGLSAQVCLLFFFLLSHFWKHTGSVPPFIWKRRSLLCFSRCPSGDAAPCALDLAPRSEMTHWQRRRGKEPSWSPPKKRSLAAQRSLSGETAAVLLKQLLLTRGATLPGSWTPLTHSISHPFS